MSERHQEGLAHLLYGIDRGGGFVALTGEVGTGKTTLCHCLLQQLPEKYRYRLDLESQVERHRTVGDDLRRIGHSPRGDDGEKPDRCD
ncbi:AAA family ATPase [Methylomonas sp. EFPC3]|uniref:ATP-binding protein n=1 Tax=Methylomonas sp. EFPC3 TaxID=3021710 RepID=UPI002415D739|nr:AAA family ATPase [Methylomonas sp. EFPC3]WFP49839.1 AAA family ATPase [Methylomonas sp. EFPC3]